MRERVEMRGGRFEVVTEPNRGFSILARMPTVHDRQVAAP
jgi:signal transduction histidine kinase